MIKHRVSEEKKQFLFFAISVQGKELACITVWREPILGAPYNNNMKDLCTIKQQ